MKRECVKLNPNRRLKILLIFKFIYDNSCFKKKLPEYKMQNKFWKRSSFFTPKILLCDSRAKNYPVFFIYFFRFGTREKVQKERNFVFILFSIVLTFFFCHVLSVVVDFFELMHVNQARGAGRQNRQHPLHRLTLRCLTQPLPALSAGTTLPVRLYNCRQSRRGDVGWVVSRRRESAVRSQSDIQYMYSLGQTEPQNKKRVPTTLLILEKKPNPKKWHLGVLILASCWKEEIFKFVHPVQCPPFGLE